MPSQILHALFGEDLIAGLERAFGCRFVTEGCRPAFILGCQGPDIFYHNQMTRPVGLEYGTLLHRRGSGTFSAALLALAGVPGTILSAYALGFMTHAFLDRACHPYIVYKTWRLDGGRAERTDLPVRNIHAFFERIIDALMLRELRGAEVAEWDQDSLAQTCENPPRGLPELLAEALRQAFPERAGKDAKLAQRIDNTFRDCAGFYRCTAPAQTSFLRPQTAASRELPGQMPGDVPLVYIYPEELPGDIDYLNVEHRPWQYPVEGGAEDARSLPEIYAQALQYALETLAPLLVEYRETGLFPTALAAERIGNGGLSIQDTDGKPCAPSRSEPLPLELVLEQQRRQRISN